MLMLPSWSCRGKAAESKLLSQHKLHVGMNSSQLWGPEEDIPDLVSDDSEEEEALVARPPRPPRPDAEALLTLGVSLPSLLSSQH